MVNKPALVLSQCGFSKIRAGDQREKPRGEKLHDCKGKPVDFSKIGPA
jgi:hypothetical protein